MPNVFVTNIAGHDLDKLKSYGILVPITIGHINLSSPDRAMFKVIQKVRDSAPEDWLALVGHSFVVGISIATWMYIHKRVQLLVWDRRLQRYREVILTENHLMDMLGVLQDG